MPRRMTIPFVGQQAKARSAQVNNQQTLNLITGIKGNGAKARVILESAPGLVELGVAGNGVCRSPAFIQWRHPVDGTVDTYAVFGSQLVRIAVATGVTVIGTLLTTAGTVRLARGRTHIVAVDGTAGYTYDGTTFAQISDLDFPDAGSSPVASPTHVVYQDGFFIVNDAFTDSFYISAIEDPTSWNALDFEAAGAAPDRALALATTRSILWVIGGESAQAYYNSGDATFPFAPILNATQQAGILAPQSIADSDSGVFFLGTTPEGGRFIYHIAGQSGKIITGEEQETELASVTDLSGAVGGVYNQAGKAFYWLMLDPARPTLVYNIRAQAWESRALMDESAWRINGTGVFNDQTIGGSRTAGRYYRLDLDNYTDAGEAFVRRRVTQIQHSDGHLLDWWEVVVDCQSGVGTASGAGEDPQLRLRFSDDGGLSWSSQLFSPLGKQGERLRRAVFRALGQSRSRTFEVEMADPAELTIISAYAAVEVLED